MDEFVKCKLNEWNLQVLISTFEENFIDEEAFKILNVEAITSLIEKIGLRLKFMKLWEQEFKRDNYPVIVKDGNYVIDPCNTAEVILNDSQLPVIDITELGNILEQSESEIISVNGAAGNSTVVPEAKSTSESEHIAISKKSDDFLSLLRKSVKGIGVIKKHALGHKFDQETRLALAEAVISVEILKYNDYKISTSRLTELAALIESTFPPEKAATYYIPYKQNEVTKKRILSKEECTDVTVKVDWLRNCLEPWPTVEKYWQETAKHRIQLLTSSEAICTSDKYLTTFKVLQQPLGLNLVKIDFSIVHPDKKLSLFAKWPEFQQQNLKYCHTKKQKDGAVKELLELLPDNFFNDQTNEDLDQSISDCLAVLALRLLPLLQPCPYLKVGKNPVWRPTKAEVQNEFLLHVTSIGELETELAIRKRKHQKHGLTEQPIAIVVGENLKTIDKYLVCINDIKYSTNSVLAAVDATFQSFFALQLEYPREAELPWLVVQQRIYDIQDESEKNIPSVSTLINDLAQITA